MPFIVVVSAAMCVFLFTSFFFCSSQSLGWKTLSSSPRYTLFFFGKESFLFFNKLEGHTRSVVDLKHAFPLIFFIILCFGRVFLLLTYFISSFIPKIYVENIFLEKNGIINKDKTRINKNKCINNFEARTAYNLVQVIDNLVGKREFLDPKNPFITFWFCKSLAECAVPFQFSSFECFVVFHVRATLWSIESLIAGGVSRLFEELWVQWNGKVRVF